MVRDFNAGGKKITNVETATQDTDAVHLLQLNQGISTANTAQTAAAQSATQAEGLKMKLKYLGMKLKVLKIVQQLRQLQQLT